MENSNNHDNNESTIIFDFLSHNRYTQKCDLGYEFMNGNLCDCSLINSDELERDFFDLI